MTGQTDFWKPQQYNFEALVTGVSIDELALAHVRRAGAHVHTIINWPADWSALERHHDTYDRSYFESAGIPQTADVWDNRRRTK
jgi:hypothetical protein